MLQTLSRNWWAVALRGVAAILFGLAAFVWPQITVYALVLLFGAYCLVDGAFTLAAAFSRSAGSTGRGWLVVRGLAGIAVGVLTFVWPGITALALLWVIAAWAVVTGVLEIVTAIRLRRELRNEWLLVLSGALTVVFGVLLVVWPASGVLALITLIGSFALVFGVLLVALAVRLHRHGGRPVRRAATRNRPRPTTA
jgi:uncharacterized membrane protein HdeD (DUF308 family)